MQAAGDLAARPGIGAENIGLRSANPMNHNPLADSIRKAGTVLQISDTLERGSVMQTAAANLAQILFDAPDAPFGCALVWEPGHPGAGTGDHVLPQPRWLIDSIN